MDYRIAPTRLPGRSGRSVAAIALVVAVAIAFGLVGSVLVDQGSPHDAAAERSSTPSRLTEAAIPNHDVRCHAVAAARCIEIATAAIGAVVDPALPSPTSVDVWATLLCGNTFDCPPYHLVDRRPAGSAVIGFAGVHPIWVNVSESMAGPERAGEGPTFDAWVVASGPTS